MAEPDKTGSNILTQRCRELIQQGQSLFVAKQPLNWLHQQFAEQFYPMRADFTRTRYLSEEFASYAMTGKPFQVQRDLGNSFSAMLRPAGQEWFKPQTDRDEINNDQQAKRWLEMAGRVMRRVFADPAVSFERGTKQGDNDFSTFGQTVLQVEPNAMLTKPLLRAWHLRDCCWTENAENKIDYFNRNWKLTARALNQKFKGNVSPHVKTMLEKEPFREVNCRHIVLPTEEYDLAPGGKDMSMKRRQEMKKGLPFVSIYVDVDNEFMIEETHVPTLGGYFIPRWVMAGSQYAYSPAAVVGLPDARMRQQMALTLLEARQKAVDPPMIAVGEAINGGINLYAGGQTYVDPDYDERTGEVLRPIAHNFEALGQSAEWEKMLDEALTEAFYLNKIALPEITKDMTAYETQKRFEEYIRQATPLFEPVSSEYNGQMCEEFFGVLMRHGAFGSPLDMPRILRGQNVHFGFESPIKSAQGKATAEAFGRLAQLLGAAMQIDPRARFVVKVSPAFRDAATGTGAKADWLTTEDEEKALADQDAARQQAAEQAAHVASTAEGVGAVGQAVKNVGDAATSLNEAGLT